MVEINPVHKFSTLSFGVVGVATKVPLNSTQEIDDFGGDAQREMDLLQIRRHPILQMLAKLCDYSSKPNMRRCCQQSEK